MNPGSSRFVFRLLLKLIRVGYAISGGILLEVIGVILGPYSSRQVDLSRGSCRSYC